MLATTLEGGVQKACAMAQGDTDFDLLRDEPDFQTLLNAPPEPRRIDP